MDGEYVEKLERVALSLGTIQHRSQGEAKQLKRLFHVKAPSPITAGMLFGTFLFRPYLNKRLGVPYKTRVQEASHV